jgi:ferredoxin
MKVRVDNRVCGGHSDCTVTAPEVFAFVDDDDEVVTVIQPEPPARLGATVQMAADYCPTQAISIEG